MHLAAQFMMILLEAFSESDSNLKPKSIYGQTKLFNEEYIEKLNSRTDCIGLRFFSVYGPFGRPDMAYFSFTESLKKDNQSNFITVVLWQEI